jgi:Ca-activated chloride channel family protein
MTTTSSTLAATTGSVPSGEVRLSARLDRSAVLSGSDGQAHVEVTLEAGAADARAGSAHRPSDVLVVLDISGSMSGSKLAYAKQALHQLIGRIQPSDRFGLVTYESTARVVVPLQAASEENPRRWHHAVDALETAGGTNMSAGLDLALTQLAQAHREHTARVLLLSDGQANEGDATPDGLRSRTRRFVRAEHVLSTMGVGDDFNEDLMTALAQTGTGNFYYLSQVAQLGRFFDAELRAATETVADAVELRFEGDPSVRVVDVSGYELEHVGNGVRVRPGNLYAGQKRTLWVTLQVPTGTLGSLDVGRFVLAYKQQDRARELTTGNLPKLACVADREQWKRGIDKQLWEQLVITEQYEKAKLDLGGAIGRGSANDIDKTVGSYAENRELAKDLGSASVLQQIDKLEQEQTRAKQAAVQPESVRSLEAKQVKARATFKRRADAYNDDPLAGMAE